MSREDPVHIQEVPDIASMVANACMASSLFCIREHCADLRIVVVIIIIVVIVALKDDFFLKMVPDICYYYYLTTVETTVAIRHGITASLYHVR